LPFIPKFPPGCAHLDLKEVERVLTRHRANISEAAKELGVSRTDLRRLTWHKPKLLEEALLWCGVYVDRCNGLLIQALYGKSRRRREWAADKILSSSMAYGGLLSPAPREVAAGGVSLSRIVVEREAAVELVRERAAERERERAIEIEDDRRRELEGAEIVAEIIADIEPPRARQVQVGWPTWIRRPTRGRGWR
jgi:hypothetical protein